MSSAVESLQLYRRTTDYIAAAMINKPRAVGDWGPVPAINLIQGALKQTGANVRLVAADGAPALLAGAWLEGSLEDFGRDRDGLDRLVRAYAWPGGFAPQVSPQIPGVIHAGGSPLATAAGAALDDPDALVACVIGEGEIGPMHPGVLAIVLAGDTPDEQLIKRCEGFGWQPQVVRDEAELLAALPPKPGGLIILRVPGAAQPDDARSYDLGELFDADGAPVVSVPAAATGPARVALELPDVGAHAVGDEAASAVGVLDAYLDAVPGVRRFGADVGLLPGYVLTGRHGVHVCEDAPVALIDRHVRFLAGARGRAPVAGLNVVVTGDARDVVAALLTRPEQLSRICLPADANTLLVTMDRCLRSTDVVNLVVAAAHPLPQWLSLDAAKEHVSRGASAWDWASNDDGEPDIVLAACGATATVELLAAASLLRAETPELRVRFVNVNDLYALASSAHHPSGLSQSQFTSIFTKDRPVLFNFHGHPSAVHQLISRRPKQTRFHVRGLTAEVANTTPFDRLAINGVDRYQLAVEALTRADILAAEMLPGMSGEFAVRAVAGAESAINGFRAKLEAVRAEIRERGEDPPEISEWEWTADGGTTIPETPGPVM